MEAFAAEMELVHSRVATRKKGIHGKWRRYTLYSIQSNIFNLGWGTRAIFSNNYFDIFNSSAIILLVHWAICWNSVLGPKFSSYNRDRLRNLCTFAASYGFSLHTIFPTGKAGKVGKAAQIPRSVSLESWIYQKSTEMIEGTSWMDFESLSLIGRGTIRRCYEKKKISTDTSMFVM